MLGSGVGSQYLPRWKHQPETEHIVVEEMGRSAGRKTQNSEPIVGKLTRRVGWKSVLWLNKSIFSLKYKKGLKFVPFNLTTTTVAHSFSTVFFYYRFKCNNCLAHIIRDKGSVCTACKREWIKTIKNSFRELVLYNSIYLWRTVSNLTVSRHVDFKSI